MAYLSKINNIVTRVSSIVYVPVCVIIINVIIIIETQ